MLDGIIRKIPIKQFTAWYLLLLLAVSASQIGRWDWFFEALFVTALYAGLDLGVTYARRRIWYFPLSSLISGLILGLVAVPVGLFGDLLLPILAVGSKHFLHFGKIRHVFNPAAFAIGVASFFIPTANWWGTSLPGLPYWLIVGAGIFIVIWLRHRAEILLPFLITYGAFLVLLGWREGTAVAGIISSLASQFTGGSFLFFVTVMLIEPLTSTFSRTTHRMVFGAGAALVAALATLIIPILPFADPLIFGLLAANLIAGLLYLPKKPSRGGIEGSAEIIH